MQKGLIILFILCYWIVGCVHKSPAIDENKNQTAEDMATSIQDSLSIKMKYSQEDSEYAIIPNRLMSKDEVQPTKTIKVEPPHSIDTFVTDLTYIPKGSFRVDIALFPGDSFIFKDSESKSSIKMLDAKIVKLYLGDKEENISLLHLIGFNKGGMNVIIIRGAYLKLSKIEGGKNRIEECKIMIPIQTSDRAKTPVYVKGYAD